MTRLLFLTSLIFSAFALAACGGGDDDDLETLAEAETAGLGQDTKDLVDELPEGLIGDKANARYTNEPLRGEDEGGE